jgi:hypothetical protein
MVHVKDLVPIQSGVRELPEGPRENILLLKIVVPFLGKTIDLTYRLWHWCTLTACSIISALKICKRITVIRHFPMVFTLTVHAILVASNHHKQYGGAVLYYSILLCSALPTLGTMFRLAQFERNLPMMKKSRRPEMTPFYIFWLKIHI